MFYNHWFDVITYMLVIMLLMSAACMSFMRMCSQVTSLDIIVIVLIIVFIIAIL